MRDVLTEVLNLLRIRTTLYALTQLRGEWGVAFPAGDLAYFHVVTGAGAHLTVEGQDGRVLEAGDAVLLAHGSAHRVTSSPHGPVLAAFDPGTWRANGRSVAEPAGPDDGRQQGPTTGLVCGAVLLESPRANPLIGALPTLVHLPAGSPRRSELDGTLALIDREGTAAGPGSEVLLARLGDILLVQTVRAWLAEQPASQGGWLGALRDPQIGTAIAAIHAAPERPWTVAALAETAALSRSRFSERFSSLVGQPPLSYLQRWRMTLAADMLRRGDRTVADIGHAIGYRSEPAFSRAFRRIHGIPPRRFGSGSGDRAPVAWKRVA
jgi:AraC-like DNA-binding protein